VIEETQALVEYRQQEAREALEEAEILRARNKNRGAMNRVYYAFIDEIDTALSVQNTPAS
jgi:uncharacterized protein (UPF0332 family)